MTEENKDSFIALPDISGHSKRVYTLGWNSSGNCLASGSVDKSLRLWNIQESGEVKHMGEMRGHSDIVQQLCWDPTNNDRLASASRDRTVRVWDTKCKLSISLEDPGFFTHMMVQASKLANTVSTSAPNLHLAYSYDGRYIAVGNEEEVVNVIDTRTYRIIRKMTHPYQVNELKFSSSGVLFAATCHPSGHGMIELMRLDTAPNKKTSQLVELHKVIAHTAACFCIDFDPLNRYFAVGGQDSLVSLWDLEEFVCVRTIDRAEEGVQCVCFSHDGQFLASSSEDMQIDIAYVETGEKAYGIQCKATVQYMSWHPKSLMLAYVGDESTTYPERSGTIKIVAVKSKS